MNLKGKIINWDDDKGFGFVEPIGGGNRCFVHIKAFENRSRRPITGDLIVYQQQTDTNGKYKAKNIAYANERKSKSFAKKNITKSKKKNASRIITFLFFTILAVTIWQNLIPITLLYLYCGASVITVLFYAIDKSAARNQRWRTPEKHLYLMSLLGGWPGAFFAQHVFRHKSSKVSFIRIHWIVVMLNISAFFYLLTANGQQFISNFIG